MTPRNEPVVIRTAIVAALTALLHVAVILGWAPIDPDAEDAIAGALDLVGVAVAAVWARQGVTPYHPEHAAEEAPEVDETLSA